MDYSKDIIIDGAPNFLWAWQLQKDGLAMLDKSTRGPLFHMKYYDDIFPSELQTFTSSFPHIYRSYWIRTNAANLIKAQFYKNLINRKMTMVLVIFRRVMNEKPPPALIASMKTVLTTHKLY